MDLTRPTPQDELRLRNRRAFDPYAADRAFKFFAGTYPVRQLPPEYGWQAMCAEYFVRRDQRAARYEGLGDYLLESAGKATYSEAPVYLRFGLAPPGDRSSTELRDGLNEFGGHSFIGKSREPGISVFGGTMTPLGYVVELTNLLQLELIKFITETRRPAYLVWGPVLRARGMAGESLLRRIHRRRVVPKDLIVAASRNSRTLEEWNRRRGGRLEDRPELAEFFAEKKKN